MSWTMSLWRPSGREKICFYVFPKLNESPHEPQLDTVWMFPLPPPPPPPPVRELIYQVLIRVINGCRSVSLRTQQLCGSSSGSQITKKPLCLYFDPSFLPSGRFITLRLDGQCYCYCPWSFVTLTEVEFSSGQQKESDVIQSDISTLLL